MTILSRKIVAFLIALPCLSVGQQSATELHVILPDSDDIEISEQEKRDLAISAASLVPSPSEVLLESLDSEDGIAWFVDQRDETDALHPLRMTIQYPEMIVDDSRRYEPKILCEGSFDPLVWNYCRESTDSWLRLPGYNFVRINHESITLGNIPEMFSTLDDADLASPTGATLASTGVHHILFNSRTGLYHLVGESGNGEQFFAYLRPIDDGDGATYEMADWTCQ